MDLIKDFAREIERDIASVRKSEEQRIVAIGEKAVEVAVENGTYHDVTGRLRRSNGFRLEEGKAILYNSAPYAEEVSARGHEVLDSAAKFLDEEIKRLNT